MVRRLRLSKPPAVLGTRNTGPPPGFGILDLGFYLKVLGN